MPINIDPAKVQWDDPETKNNNIPVSDVQWDAPPKQLPAKRSVWESVGRSVGISGRTLAQGLSNMLGIVGDPLNTIINQFLPEDRQLNSIRGATKKVLKDAGVPDYEGKTEEVLGKILELATETLATSGTGGLVARTGRAAQKGISAVEKPAMRVARSLAEEPVKQVVAAEAGLAGGEAVREVAPDSTLGQIAGNVAGAMIGSKATGMGSVGAGKYQEPELVKQGRELGVDILTSDVFKPKGAVGRLAQMVSERAPMGTHSLRTEQLAQKKQMVDKFIDEIGANVPDDLKASIVDDIVTKRKSMFNRYANMKQKIFNTVSRKGAVPTPTIEKVINDEIALAEHLNLDSYGKELQNLKDQAQAAFQPAGGGKMTRTDIKYLDKIRALFGEKLKSQDFESIREHANKSKTKIYAAFNEDIGNFIKAHGGSNDYNKWKAVNKKIAGLIGEEKMGAFKRVLKQADVQPEVVKTMIKTEDASVVKQLYKSASPQGKKLIRAAVMQDIIGNRGLENLTPQKFVDEVTKRGRSIGVHFDEKNKKILKAMVQLQKDTLRAEKSTTYTPIGVAMPLFVMNLLNSMFGGGVAGTIAASASTAGIGLLSKVVESKQSRDLLLRIQHLRNGLKIPNREKKLEVAVRQFFNTIQAYSQEEKANE